MPLFKDYALIGRFFISGGFSTLAYIALSICLNHYFPIGMIYNHVIAYALCIPLSYILQSRYAFRYTGSHYKASGKFMVLTVVGFLTGVVITCCVDAYNVHYVVGTFLVAVLIPVMNYVVMKIWVFSMPESRMGR
ncbi:MAG: GtrA family protein [Alphaproteobacteria bacterium]|nr:GtrA family protein [Alphaproteobacteria bacterium]